MLEFFLNVDKILKMWEMWDHWAPCSMINRVPAVTQHGFHISELVLGNKVNMTACIKFSYNPSLFAKVIGPQSSTNPVPADLLMLKGLRSILDLSTKTSLI